MSEVCYSYKWSIGAKYNGKEKNWFLTKNKKNLELVKKLCDGCNKEAGSDRKSSYIIDYDEIDKIRGMDISISTSAKTDDEARELLRLMGAPFAK